MMHEILSTLETTEQEKQVFQILQKYASKNLFPANAERYINNILES
jgi:hypothetical protein